MLVVTPAAMRLVWAEEVERWLPHLRPAHLHVIESSADRLQAPSPPLLPRPFPPPPTPILPVSFRFASLDRGLIDAEAVVATEDILFNDRASATDLNIPLQTLRFVFLQGSDALPRMVICSYEMLHRLTCESCKRSTTGPCTGAAVST